MEQLWLELEEELYQSFSVIAIHTSMRPSRLAYALNSHLGIQLKRTKEDVDLKKDNIDFYFPLFEFRNENLHHEYNLVGNRNIQVGKQGGTIHYEELDTDLRKTVYLLPEFKKVDYFLKVDFDDNCLSLEATLRAINAIRGVQSAY